MLAVQEYLQSNTVDSLEQFGIFAKVHPNKPFMILDYDQIESCKFKEDPKVKECRGLVLRTDNYEIVHKSFNRFFNLNESSCTDKFDWSNFSTSTKEDGSLIKVRYYEGEFVITTRNSFADSECGSSGNSWSDLVLSCLNSFQKDCIQCYNILTFVFELCTPHNTVVVNHPEPKLVLLGLFGDDGIERNVDDYTFFKDHFNRPETFDFKSLDEIIAYLDKLEEDKNDTEGVVVKDCNGIRLKAKSKWYLKLHRLSGNGNIALTKNVLPIILSGEKDEILSYFPYLEDKFNEVENILADLFTDVVAVWHLAKDLEDQKTFALFITKNHPTPFSSILFKLKKIEKINDFEALKHEWNQSAQLIIKVLKED